ncbi:MAG: substrate-binding domain-containing protein [Opitutaceae bacterium]|nr:substrate-binding domain-containing protein [Opitutaceae bacterium]
MKMPCAIVTVNHLAARLTRRRVRPALALLAAAILAAGCTRQDTGNAIAKTDPSEKVLGLPDYRPEQKVAGILRAWGDNNMGTLMKLWQEGFQKYHPEIRYADVLKGNNSAMFGLQEWVADMAVVGRQIYPNQLFGTLRRSMIYPVEVTVATTSFDTPRKAPALVIFVHKDNPLAKLTMKQLDGIFGVQRTGGWHWLTWHPEEARGPEGNIRTWGQLGLTGDWANKPIHPYGSPSRGAGAITFFQTRVLGGSDLWTDDYREYVDPREMLEVLAKDPLGIAYAGMCYRNSQVKPLALAKQDGGPYVEPTRATVADQTYPLARHAYIYFTVDQPNGDPADPRIDPKVKEFLRYILSRQGQQDVVREGDYLPLTEDVVRAQLAKLQ